MSEAEWRGVVRQLLAAELLGVDSDGYGTLRLTPSRASVLRGERTVLLRREPEKAARLALAVRELAAPGRCRSRRADRLGCSRSCARGGPERRGSRACPRTWCSTTRRCGRSRVRQPSSLEELGTVSGVGATKLERYGPGVLAALAG